MSTAQGNVLPGFSAAISVGLGLTSTLTALGYITSIKKKAKQDFVDVTDVSDAAGGWENGFPTMKDWNLSIGGFWASNEEGKAILISLIQNGGIGTFLVTPKSGAGTYSGTGIVTNFQHDIPNVDLQTVSFDIEGLPTLSVS